MINKIIGLFKNLDTKIVKLMHYGFASSLIVCLLSVLILVTYSSSTLPLDFFYSALLLFKAGVMISVASTICGIAFDTIQKNLAK